MNGQDKIITISHDTIECKILSISSTHLNYEQTSGDHIVGKFIPVSEVAEYYKGSGRRNMLNVDNSTVTLRLRPESFRFRHWLAGVGSGGSYLTASTVEAENVLVNEGIPRNNAENYYTKFRNGVQVNANIHYLFDIGNDVLDMGIGLKYRYSSFSAQMDAMLTTQSYVYLQYAINEKAYINYLGLSYILQHWLGQNRKFGLACEVSAGYVSFRDETRSEQYNFLGTGKTFGLNAGIIFAYYLFDYMSLNVDFNYFSAVLKRLNVSDGVSSIVVEFEKGKDNNLSHLNYSLGVRFHF
jgi:hypothetical protein